MMSTKRVVSTAPHTIGMLNSISKAMAPPRISAREVDMEANTAVPRIGLEIHLGVYLVAASLKQSPVTMPKCATLCWRIMSMIVERVTTHKSAYPNSDPAAKLEAQLPGSIKPTVTKSPGPMYLKKSKPPKYRLWFLFFSSFQIFAIIFLLNEQI